MTTLFELCSLSSAGVSVLDCEHKTPAACSDGFPYIAIPDVQDGRVVIETARRISAADLEEWTRRTIPQPGDVILTRRGRVGDTAPIPAGIRCAIGQNLVLLRSDGRQLVQAFLRWAVRSPQWWSEVDRLMNVGAVFSSLNVRDIAKIRVPVPPLLQQQAIAEVLGALDDKIAANTKLAQTSATLAQALLAGLMRAADPEVALSEVTELLSRGVAPKYSDAEDTVVVLNQKCIRDQRVNLDPARRTIISKVRGEKMLRMDDVLVNSTGQGTLGRVARWTNSGSVTVDSHITIVRFDQAKVDPVCAGMALMALQKTIEEMGEGSTGQTELSRTELGKLRIRLPERSLQAELGQRIKSMSEMETARLSENQTLAATRDTLLPRLMSGKLHVKDAEKLLEKAGV